MWPYPKIIAHRGGGTLAPENTIAALRCGMDYGFRAVEFDVMLARDGIGVVLHDEVLGRTVKGAGKVSDYSAAELAGMDAGSWFGSQFVQEGVPAFSDFIDYCQAQQIWMNIEIKPAPGFERQTGQVVGQLISARFALDIAAGVRLPLLSSFSLEALTAAHAAAPALPRGWLVDVLPADWLAQMRALGAQSLHTNHRHLTQTLAQAVKQAGFGLFCYTVNDAAQARILLDWGVDAFCTDRIDLIGPDF